MQTHPHWPPPKQFHENRNENKDVQTLYTLLNSSKVISFGLQVFLMILGNHSVLKSYMFPEEMSENKAILFLERQCDFSSIKSNNIFLGSLS